MRIFGSLLDTILDRTVAPGYTSIGYRLRRPMWDELPRMDGKVVLVTGATSGIGESAAEGFARVGASVRLLVRSAERGERTRAAIVAATGNEDVRTGICDLSDLASVRAYAAQFLDAEPRLDVLVNNAGLLPGERTLTADGLELAFATNVLGPFLLTNLLTPLLARSAPSRIVSVSSGGMYTAKIDVGDLQSARGKFDGAQVYARTKRAEVILTEIWAERLAGSGVVAHAMHPGWVDTPGVQTSLPTFHKVTGPFLRSVDQGADTILWLGAADEPAHSSGLFWHDRRARPTHRAPWTKESARDRERLWDACAQLSGWTDPTSANPQPGAA